MVNELVVQLGRGKYEKGKEVFNHLEDASPQFCIRRGQETGELDG
jgi:hypothetical protein